MNDEMVDKFLISIMRIEEAVQDLKDTYESIKAAQQDKQAGVCTCKGSPPPTDVMLIDPMCPVHGERG